MVELFSLKRQLENLIAILEDAKKSDKSLDEIGKIIKQIKEVERSIEKREQLVRRNQSPN
jgi:hypothetical protein